MQPVHKNIHQASLYLLANIINAGVPFLFTLILSRMLIPSELAICVMFTVLFNLFSPLLGLNLDCGVAVKYFQLNRTHLAQYIGVCVCILLMLTTGLSIVVLCIGPWLVSITGIPQRWLWAVVILSSVQFFCNTLLAFWRSEESVKKYSVFQITQAVFNLGLSLLFIVLMQHDWVGRLWGQTVTVLLFATIAVGILCKQGLITWTYAAWQQEGQATLHYGFPLLILTLGGLASVLMGQFVVAKLLGLVSLGIYAVAFQFGSALNLPLDALSKVFWPWLCKKLSTISPDSQLEIVRVSYGLFATFLLIAALLYIGVYWVFDWIIGPAYGEAKHLIGYFIFGFCFVGMYNILSGFYLFLSKNHYLASTTLFSGLITLGIMIYAGHTMGLAGIAGAFFIGQVLRFVLIWGLLSKIYPLPWGFPVKTSISMVRRTCKYFL